MNRDAREILEKLRMNQLDQGDMKPLKIVKFIMLDEKTKIGGTSWKNMKGVAMEPGHQNSHWFVSQGDLCARLNNA